MTALVCWWLLGIAGFCANLRTIRAGLSREPGLAESLSAAGWCAVALLVGLLAGPLVWGFGLRR
jgi:hypothetical protein